MTILIVLLAGIGILLVYAGITDRDPVEVVKSAFTP